jgi:hypothetical protein
MGMLDRVSSVITAAGKNFGDHIADQIFGLLSPESTLAERN